MRYLVLTFLLFTSASWAGCNNIACYGVGKDVLTRTYLSSTGNIYIGAPVGKENLKCDLFEGQYMTLKMNHLLYREIYSTILTGIAAQKQLQIRIVENSPECEVSYVTMNP
ncbi:hypothetical protein Q4491_04705 [Photobacterium sp. 2_MG-2023]|uniref:hypothetical protein n=1 Tax=Photobacterium sp. 2_MG-2023 TaxID=3062663 RepID=UPI0026E40B4B|nr:hypothetical protein [Photobacterium sp. 2_MG-2023]MDO6580639.1 hypothetical protein [Photobacterium sp. 2_MG-2023]